jgi:hypothetical protein
MLTFSTEFSGNLFHSSSTDGHELFPTFQFSAVSFALSSKQHVLYLCGTLQLAGCSVASIIPRQCNLLLLFSRLLSKNNLKIRIYKRIILPVVLYGWTASVV